MQKAAEDKVNRLSEKHKRAQHELEAHLAEKVNGAQSNAEERIKEISANLEAEQVRLRKAEAKVEKLQTEKEQLAEKMQDKLSKETATVAELQGELKTLNKELKAMLSERDALSNEKQSLAIRLADLESTQKKLSEEVESVGAKHEKKMGKLETRLKAMEAERDALAGERDALDSKIKAVERAKADIESRAEAALKEKADMEQQLAEFETAKQEMEAAQERLKTSEEAVNGHEARIAGVVAQLESEQKEVERLEKQLKESTSVHKTTLESLTTAQKALERERTELLTELNALKEADSLRKNKEGNEQNKALEARLLEQTREVDNARRILKESEELRLQLEERQARIQELEHQALEAESQRRALHNQIQELRGNVRVFCRVRPTENEPAVKCAPDGSSLNLTRADGKENAAFEFDRVFDPSSKQEEIFEEVSQLVQSALDGYKVCLFSYGQTGSGKTHTMLGEGNGDMQGIIPRSVAKIVEASEKNAHKGWKYTMHASYVEIYNEQVRDLLKPGSSHSDKHSIVHKNGVTEVSGVQREHIDSVESAAALVRRASAARVVEATNMNAQSSRSHTIFMLYIVGEHASSGSEMTGCLNLVDLAGSERVGRYGAEGKRLKEACAINKSLSSLGDVFSALAAKQAHVPYRNSKLTYLLQPCLGGDGKTLMFVNINPETASAEETMCSLKFAAQVNAVQLGDGKGAQRRITTKMSAKSEDAADEKKEKPRKEKESGERKRKAISSSEPRKK